MSPASVTLLAALASSDPLEAAAAVEHRADSSDCRLADHQAVCLAAAAGATAGTLHERDTSPGGHTQAVWGGAAADAVAGTAGDPQERGQHPGQAPASDLTPAVAHHQGAALRSSQQDWQIIGKFCSLTVPEAWLRGVVRAWQRTAWVLQHGRRLQQVGWNAHSPGVLHSVCAAAAQGLNGAFPESVKTRVPEQAAHARDRSPDRLLLSRAWTRQPCSVKPGPALACCMLQALAARHLRRVLRGWRHATATQARRLHLLSTTLAEQHDLGVLERALHTWQHVRAVTHMLLHQSVVLPTWSGDVPAVTLPA